MSTTQPGPTSDLEDRLQRLVDRVSSRRRIRNVVAGIHSTNREIEASAAAGSAGADGQDAMTTTTPYHLASITKMYTATVVMKLAESNRISLDSPISDFLDPGVFDAIHVLDGVDSSAQISVEQLLAQTSGVADYFEGKPKGGASLVDDLTQGRDRALDIAAIAEIARRLTPEFVPGARAQYSDTNYALLGAIIEAVTGRSVATNFEEFIFDPLGLANTFVFDHAQPQPRPAVIYAEDRVLEIPLAMSSLAPDGGLVSTLDDSLRFLRAFFTGELLTDDQLRHMTSQWNRIQFPLRYGYGLMKFELPRWMSPFKAPPELIGHSGSTGSFAFYNPKRAIFLAGTVNQMDKPGRPYRLMTQMIGLVDKHG